MPIDQTTTIPGSQFSSQDQSTMSDKSFLIRQNVLKLQNANAMPQDIDDYVRLASQESGIPSPQQPGTFSFAPGTFLDRLQGGLNTIFPAQQTGSLIGGLLAKSGLTGLNPQQRQNVNVGSLSQIPRVAGELGQNALTIGTAGGLGTGGSLLAQVGKSAALGGGFGLTSSLAQGQGLGDTAKNIALGGTIGGAIPLAGAGLQKAGQFITENLPTRLAKFAFPGANTQTAQYAVENKSIGTIGGMLNDSRNAVKSMGGQIDSILQHPDYAEKTLNGPDILNQVIKQFPNSKYTIEDIADKAQSLAPNVGKLLDKFQQGDMSLFEANTIRKEIDIATKSVYTSLTRPPEVKQIGAALAGQIRDLVQDSAPETKPIFSSLQKEINLRGILTRMGKSADKASAIGLKDLIAAGLGGLEGGIPGAITGGIIRHVVATPAATLTATKFLNLLGKASPILTNPAVTNIARTGILRTLSP